MSILECPSPSGQDVDDTVEGKEKEQMWVIMTQIALPVQFRQISCIILYLVTSYTVSYILYPVSYIFFKPISQH